jgi:Holliday junction resolvase RusA-like endonuclease
MIAFFVPGKPVGQGAISTINGRSFHSNGAVLKPWRQLVGIYARNAGTKPSTKAIELTVKFFIERGKTVTRKYPTVAPDLDHYVRACGDALKGIAYLDDAQVIKTTSQKLYADNGQIPGVGITISEID